MAWVTVIWDLDDDPHGNVQHIAANGLSKNEIDDVLLNPANETDQSHSTERPATFGWTATGRHIIVLWEEVNNDPRMLYPVTAYEVPPKGGS